jgi:lysophospholipase
VSETGDASGLLRSTAANPVPQGLQGQIITTPDGMLLRCATLRPPVARGTVMLLQGRGEFIERYFETINDLVRRGFAVVTFDWRGQGGSTRLTRDGRRGHVRSFADYDTDLDAVAEQVMLPDLPPPYLGLAHSTGGQVMLRALDRHGWFAGAVVVAPFLGLGVAPLPSPVVKILAPALTLAGLGKVYAFGQGRARSFLERRFEGNRLTSDQRRYQRSAGVVEAYPELGIGAPTIGWLAAALASIRKLERQKTRSTAPPVLLLAAGRDQVVSSPKSKLYAERHGIAFAVVPGARHELLQERDGLRNQVLAAFDAFVAPLVEPRPAA